MLRDTLAPPRGHRIYSLTPRGEPPAEIIPANVCFLDGIKMGNGKIISCRRHNQSLMLLRKHKGPYISVRCKECEDEARERAAKRKEVTKMSQDNQIDGAGMFCEMFGDTMRNRALEYMLEMGKLDFAIEDMAEEHMSIPEATGIISEFVAKGYVKASRIVRKTQLYTLNQDNPRVQVFLHAFKDCLKLVIDEHPPGRK